MVDVKEKPILITNFNEKQSIETTPTSNDENDFIDDGDLMETLLYSDSEAASSIMHPEDDFNDALDILPPIGVF